MGNGFAHGRSGRLNRINECGIYSNRIQQLSCFGKMFVESITLIHKCKVKRDATCLPANLHKGPRTSQVND